MIEKKRRYVVWAGVLAVVLPWAGRAWAEQRPLNAPSNAAEITRLIEELSDPSYVKRSRATRRLSAIGPVAYEQMKAAGASEDPETALRAQQILAIYDRLLFFNADVTLLFSQSKVAWSQPVDLHVTIVNRTNHGVRVPFDMDAQARSNRSAEAGQVADMLDVGDWIRVQWVDGRRIGLHVDEISFDANVVAVVQQRLNGGPIGIIKPGRQFTLTVRDFNRGWARYPLLDAGDYTVTFEYAPGWGDPKLREAGVGRITTTPVTLTITDAAPPEVSRRGIPASCRLTREGDSLAAYLVNRTDQTAVVNKNFGPSLPFASGRWVYESGSTVAEIPVSPEDGAGWSDFQAANLVTVPPGIAEVLVKVDIVALRARFEEKGVDFGGSEGAIHFQYSNACDRLWQARERATLLGNRNIPAVLREPLSRYLLSTRQSSNRLHVMDLK